LRGATNIFSALRTLGPGFRRDDKKGGMRPIPLLRGISRALFQCVCGAATLWTDVSRRHAPTTIPLLRGISRAFFQCVCGTATTPPLSRPAQAGRPDGTGPRIEMTHTFTTIRGVLSTGWPACAGHDKRGGVSPAAGKMW
jgi:hypothetical protein